jgi:hypothetical protein
MTEIRGIVGAKRIVTGMGKYMLPWQGVEFKHASPFEPEEVGAVLEIVRINS